MVDYSNIPRDSRRVPLETRVQFKFDRFDGFISEYSANISPGGMFIRTRVPQPPGTVLDFEFRLGDGFELIRGRGEVVWNRLEDEGPARPGGMGLHFLELAEGSKELIYRIVDQHVALGGTPFDIMQRPPDPVPTTPPVLPPPLSTGHALAPAGTAASQPGRFRSAAGTSHGRPRAGALLVAPGPRRLWPRRLCAERAVPRSLRVAGAAAGRSAADVRPHLWPCLGTASLAACSRWPCWRPACCWRWRSSCSATS